MNFEKMINAEETHLGITLGNKERLLVDNLLRDMVSSIKIVAPLLESKLQVAVEVMERINIGDLEYGEIYEELSMALKKIKV